MTTHRANSPFCQLTEQILLIIEEDLNRAGGDSRMKIIAEGSIARFCRVLMSIDKGALTKKESDAILQRLHELRAKIPTKSQHLVGHFNQIINRFSDKKITHSK
jgi:hypothetical protein